MPIYPITAIDGLDADMAKSLRTVGIRTSKTLLERAKDLKGRKLLFEATGIDPRTMLAFANAADRMRIKGMGREYSGLLKAVGVETVKELKYRNPGRLATAMAAANRRRKLVRVLPSENAIERWIEAAKKLDPKITY